MKWKLRCARQVWTLTWLSLKDPGRSPGWRRKQRRVRTRRVAPVGQAAVKPAAPGLRQAAAVQGRSSPGPGHGPGCGLGLRYGHGSARGAGAGYPASIINTIVVPSATLKLGFEPDSDSFLIANRNALWVDPEAGEAYVENPTYRVLRVTPDPAAVLDPFPTAPLRIRGTGQTEIDLTPTLARLREAVIRHYEDLGYTAHEYITQTIAAEGYDFTQRKITTLGDTRDALYLGTGDLPEFGLNQAMTLRDGEFLIAYGLNHMATGKATYVNLNGYTSGPSKMALGSVYPDKLKDSASQYLGYSDPDVELTYAYMISRDCEGEGFCLPLEVPIAGCTEKPDGKEILNDESPLGVVFRLYLEPSTSIGAAFAEVVYDQVIKFSRAE